jgi:prepilin-type N-terminal cleavage/methylation domain-containing protein
VAYYHSRLSYQKTLPGFTLIELAIVLMVIGLIAGAIFKGQDLLESARVRSVLNDVNRFRLAINMYQETYGALPGDDTKASIHFGASIPNGNGDGIIRDQEKTYFWQHLNKAGQLSNDTAPTSKLGGRYSVTYQPNEDSPGHWLQLGKENGDNANGGLLTPKQAQMLKSKAEEGGNLNPKQGSIRFIEGNGITAGQCVQDDHLNLGVDSPVCVMLAAF